MAAWSPLEIIALVTAIGAILGNFIMGVAALIVAMKTGAKVDGMLVQRDAAKFDAGERKGTQAGVDTAAVLAEGQRQGREHAREDHLRNGEHPLPVADDRTAIAAERSATATERVATATEDSSSLSKKT